MLLFLLLAGEGGAERFLVIVPAMLPPRQSQTSLIGVLSMITTVTGKNRITIPGELARELDIAPGTRLDWLKAKRAF
jgi:AbrB family looped-hinge helix DNA binding protein